MGIVVFLLVLRQCQPPGCVIWDTNYVFIFGCEPDASFTFVSREIQLYLDRTTNKVLHVWVPGQNVDFCITSSMEQ